MIRPVRTGYVAALVAVAAVAGLAGTAGRADAARPARLRFQPDPSGAAAAEIALGRLAREKGVAQALRATAADADTARLGLPPLSLREALKRGALPSAVTRHDPQTVYVACNGLTAAVAGLWTAPDGRTGPFATLWRRDPKKGNWRWLYTLEAASSAPRPAQDFLDGHVAVCRGAAGQAGTPPGAGEPRPIPGAPDESLVWNLASGPEGAPALTVEVWNGTGYDRVLTLDAAAETPGRGGGR